MLSIARLLRCVRHRTGGVQHRFRACLLHHNASSDARNSPSLPSPLPQITLTPAESNLFDFLVYIQHLYAPTTQLRVAGGWVRDKIRGAESDDIDIVLDNINGRTFANHIVAFQRERRLPQSSVGVVKANSDKSKHLEVATVAIEGRVVDLVHLRAEAYSADSRVPDATPFATPQDDATRRDITINALFYNLHTHAVEDLTGYGLADLSAGIIRTPLAPLQTFLDDPLRVLRAIRFACAFHFALDPLLVQALQHDGPTIRDAMVRKVSRERIGIEVQKMLSGADPTRAFDLLTSFALLDVVFNDCRDEDAAPSSDKASRPWTRSIERASRATLCYLQQSRLALASHQISFVEASGAILTPLFLDAEDVARPHIATGGAVPPVVTLSVVDEATIVASALCYLEKRNAIVRHVPLDDVVEMLKTNVKWPKPAAKRVAFIVEAVATFPVESRDKEGQMMSEAVMLFLWMTRYNSVLAPALSILLTDVDAKEELNKEATATRDATLRSYLELGALYAKREVEQGGKKRRIDGRVIKRELGDDAGPNIAKALEVLSVWELVHPTATLDDEVAFLQRLKPQL